MTISDVLVAGLALLLFIGLVALCCWIEERSDRSRAEWERDFRREHWKLLKENQELRDAALAACTPAKSEGR